MTTTRPEITDHGIRCGHCSTHWEVRRHASVADVRRCWIATEEEAAESAAEIAAELAVERFFEERGFDEARAQEQWEADRGVISFSDALAQSMGLPA
jgi:hypothetical protein